MTGSGSLAGGRYRLGQRLEKDGPYPVHLAHDVELDRPVEVRLLARGLVGDVRAAERLRQEARVSAGLNHPNIVQVHDAGEEAGRPYLVMEHVGGERLDRVLQREGPLDPEAVAGIAAEVAAALAHAHEAGVTHGGVGLRELLRARDGTVLVRGFGSSAQDPPAPAEGDLRALGTALHRLLTGEPPPAGLEPRGIERGARESGGQESGEREVGGRESGGRTAGPPRAGSELAAALRERRPEVPAALAEVVGACLAAGPGRPLRAAELVGRLAAATGLDGEGGHPESAVLIPPPEAPPGAETPPGEVATRRLPVGGDSERHPPAGGETTPIAAATQPPRHGTPPTWEQAPPTPASRRRSRLRTGLAIAAYLVLALLAALLVREQRVEAPAGGAGGAEPESRPARQDIPTSEDPAEQARQLAEWLRDHVDQ